MNISTSLATAALIGAVLTGSGCTSTTAEQTKTDAGALGDDARAGASAAVDATRKAGSEVMEASRTAAHVAAGKTRDVTGNLVEKGRDVALATGDAMTDGWMTAKVKAKFSDETLLHGSDIDVDTTDRAVTLKGRVGSVAARARAEQIASGTEGVTHVVNQLVVKSK